MERIKAILEKEGFGLIWQPRDENAFYYIIQAIKNNSEKRSWWDMRKTKNEIFEFELQYALYFHLFLTQCIACDGGHPAEDCLEKDFKQSRAEKRSPSPREIFATSEVLQRTICLYRICALSVKTIKDFQGFIFTPFLRNMCTLEPICIVMLERSDGFPDFGLIDFKSHDEKILSTCPGVLLNLEHKDCLGFKFTNNYDLLFTRSSYGRDDHVTDLFRRISFEVYNNDEHFVRIIHAICDIELKEDNVDVFYKYAEESFREDIELDEKERLLREHVEKVRSQSKDPGKGEMLALSSVLNADIFIGKENRDCWELYMPVTSTYARCHHSPILLHVILQNQDSSCYKPYITNKNECACCQDKPFILGHIGMVAENLHQTVFRASCCPSSRHAFHKHLDHIPNSRTTWPEREDFFAPNEFIQNALDRLSTEGRRIDQINGGNGTLTCALIKEIYEQKESFPSDILDILENENTKLDEKLQRVADWSSLPIYIFNMIIMNNEHRPVFHWTRFEPTTLIQTRQRRPCRFYITLFFDHSNDVFNRIIPIGGCNCNLPPPVSLLQTIAELETNMLPIEPDSRHRIFESYFSEVPNESLYCTEIRDFPPCSPYSGLRTVQLRPDMKDRTIDFVEYSDHSLLRCLSKEIFGTEQHCEFLLKELSIEILQNTNSYLPFLENITKFIFEKKFGKMKGSEKEIKELVTFAISRIEDDLPTGDFLLWVISTFFQIDVFVLRFAESQSSAESYWTEYFPLREKKDRYENSRKRQTFLTLIETQTKRYYRVVSKTDVCNCDLIAPTVPNRVQDPLSISSDHDWRITKQMRKIEAMIEIAKDAIDRWLKCNLILQQTCDQVIAEMELRRRNVNVATVSGSSAGIVGAVLTAVGIGIAPLTAGASLALSVTGGVLAVTGGTVAAGAKITETVLNTKTIEILKRYQDEYQELFETVQINLRLLTDEINRLGDIASEMKTNQEIESFDFAALQTLPGILRMVKGLTMIPLALLRISARGITILGVVIGPLSALIDVGLLAFSIRNMIQRNKTDVTENLRRISASLYGSRRQMHAWAYGNQKVFFHDSK
ncbi:uncharacterized protein LOC134281200 [Saccostrea cucullata]|uniref:uncharacterized protein LOC134281200 n=1 Tax=Saccostrea cuccullata TaxID=36930 RepID=UPI002ED0168D